MGPDGDDRNGMGKKLLGERAVRKTIGWLKQAVSILKLFSGGKVIQAAEQCSKSTLSKNATAKSR